MYTPHNIPLVLSVGGHDPTGGAGIQADIEAIAANGCHACTVLTCTTVQDTCNVKRMVPLSREDFLEQIEAVFADCHPAAIKIGLLGDSLLARSLADVLERHRDLPVVLDPILRAGGGTELADSALRDVLLEALLPLTDLATPNSEEARALGSATDLDHCAQALLDQGCGHVLITGTHEQEPVVKNRLYSRDGLVDEKHWDRLPGSFHGSGCTLAAAATAQLALGQKMISAVSKAQAFTWKSMSRALRIGQCQAVPDRFFSHPRSLQEREI